MKRKICLLVVLSLFTVLFAACAVNQAPPDLANYIVGDGLATPTPRPRETGPATAKPEDVTVEEYEQFEEGVTTYEQAVEIIGAEGRPQKERGGVQPYTWIGFTPMSKTVTMNFRDGVLISKDPQGSNLAIGTVPATEP